MGRRATKKVTTGGSVALHRRYLYRGYLQIACCDLKRNMGMVVIADSLSLLMRQEVQGRDLIGLRPWTKPE